eukprot:4735109-Pyramimonas_sp.AAC.1
MPKRPYAVAYAGLQRGTLHCKRGRVRASLRGQFAREYQRHGPRLSSPLMSEQPQYIPLRQNH